MCTEVILISETVGIYQHFSQNGLFSILNTLFSCSDKQLGSKINVLDMSFHKSQVIEESVILEAVCVLVLNKVSNEFCKLEIFL